MILKNYLEEIFIMLKNNQDVNTNVVHKELTNSQTNNTNALITINAKSAAYITTQQPSSNKNTSNSFHLANSVMSSLTSTMTSTSSF